MSSGLIGQSDFESGYGFCYIDLSRKISQASDDISRSIQAVFTNNSGVACDYYAVIGYEREIVARAQGVLWFESEGGKDSGTLTSTFFDFPTKY